MAAIQSICIPARSLLQRRHSHAWICDNVYTLTETVTCMKRTGGQVGKEYSTWSCPINCQYEGRPYCTCCREGCPSFCSTWSGQNL